MEQSETNLELEALVSGVKRKCPSLSVKWSSYQSCKSDHASKLTLIAEAAGQILIALSSTEEEAIAWEKRIAKVKEVAERRGLYGKSQPEATTELPYLKTIDLLVEALCVSSGNAAANADVQLFVKNRLTDLRGILEGYADSFNEAISVQTKNKNLEERRIRSVVFHGDIFHKPTPQYS